MKFRSALITVLLFVAITAAAYLKFEHDKDKNLSMELRSLYLQKKADDGGIPAVLFIDSLLSNNKEYKDLKALQYAKWMRAGNFNTPPSEEVRNKVMRTVNSSLKNEVHRTFIISIFRMSVMFRIVDELKNPALPTKQQIVDDFSVMI